MAPDSVVGDQDPTAGFVFGWPSTEIREKVLAVISTGRTNPHVFTRENVDLLGACLAQVVLRWPYPYNPRSPSSYSRLTLMQFTALLRACSAQEAQITKFRWLPPGQGRKGK